MSPLFRACFLLLFFLFTTSVVFSNPETSAINPVFRDSVLNNKLDTAKWNSVVTRLDRFKQATEKHRIQELRPQTVSLIFLYVATFIVICLISLRVIFDDFSNALLEGLMSRKQFFVFYKSKKYDSLLAVLFVYIFNLILLSFIVFLVWTVFNEKSFVKFNYTVFFNICMLLIVFFTVKYIIEYIFNFITDTLDTFKAFLLQSFFTEFMLSITLLVLSLIFIYNQHFGFKTAAGFVTAIVALYLVFNIVRSYQLTSVFRLPYKFHFFLYICAFKLIPILLLVKFFFNNTGLKLH